MTNEDYQLLSKRKKEGQIWEEGVPMSVQLREEKERLGFAPKRTDAADAKMAATIRKAIIKKRKQAIATVKFISNNSRRVPR